MPRLRLVASPAHSWPAGHGTSEHQHPFFELAFLQEGSCTWHLGRRKVSLEAGEILLLEPGRPHFEEVIGSGYAHIAWIGFDFNEKRPPELCHRSARKYAVGSWKKSLLALFRDIYRESQHPEFLGSQTRIECALRSLLVLFARLSSEQDFPEATRSTQSIRAAAHALASNLSAPPHIGTLARYHGMSAGYFATLFEQEYGVTPRKFLLHARLQEAQRRLTHTRESVKQIAAACGYTDSAHFCRHFKATHGCSPIAWKRTQADGIRD